jgi:competence protein ComEA
MDPASSPWRALEAPSPATAPEGSGRPAGPSGASLPLPALGAGAAAIVLAVAAFLIAAGGTQPEIEVESAAGGSAAASGVLAPSSPGDRELVVDVSGAVLRPGVYRLPPGSRVIDALTAAGGYGPRVDTARATALLNLAAPLSDGERLLIPSRDDAPSTAGGQPGDTAASGSSAGTVDGGLIDLNRATTAELERLPGIGPVTAGKIITAREERPYAAVDDLRARKIVGAATFEKIRHLVAVR